MTIKTYFESILGIICAQSQPVSEVWVSPFSHSDLSTKLENQVVTRIDKISIIISHGLPIGKVQIRLQDGSIKLIDGPVESVKSLSISDKIKKFFK